MITDITDEYLIRKLLKSVYHTEYAHCMKHEYIKFDTNRWSSFFLAHDEAVFFEMFHENAHSWDALSASGKCTSDTSQHAVVWRNYTPESVSVANVHLKYGMERSIICILQ